MKRRSVRVDRRLETLGLLCPIPITKTAAAIREMAVGEILAVLSDDTGILVDMPAWCRGTGHTFIGVEEEGGAILAYVRKEAPRRGRASSGLDFRGKNG